MQEVQAESISRRIGEFGRHHTLHVRRRDRNHDSMHAEIDDFVCALSIPHQLAFTGLGDNWQETSKSNAESTLQYILSHNISYNSPDEMPDNDAKALANEFLALFETDARFFTNGHFRNDFRDWSGWGVVTNGDFDTGIVAVDELRIGILWCNDDD